MDAPPTAQGPHDPLRHPLAYAKRVFGVLTVAGGRFFFDRCTQHAAAIGYRVLFSLAPLAIVLVSIVGVVLQDDEVRSDVVDSIVDLLPVSADGRQQVEDAVTAVASPTSFLGVVGLIVFAWTASGMMGSVRTGLETALAADRRPAARSKIVDLLLVMGAGVLVLALVAATALAALVQAGVRSLLEAADLEGHEVTTTAGIVLPIVVVSIVVLLLYRFVPARRIAFGDALAGALVTGVLLLTLSLASGLVIDKALEASAIYGSLATIFIFLYTVYLYACALLFGAEVARAWSEPPPPPDPTPLREKAENAVRGLFFRPKQRHGADPEAGHVHAPPPPWPEDPPPETAPTGGAAPS